MNSPSVQGSDSDKKGKRAQNLVPIMINEVFEAPEEGFTVEGTEVGMVQIVGRVTNVDKATTKTSYQVEDSTGMVEVVQWMEEGSSEPEHAEGASIKIIGSIRTQGEKRHLMAFRILGVGSDEERDCHLLQVAHTKLKLRQLNGKLTGGGGSGGMMDHSGLSNSMMGSGFGSALGGTMSSSSAAAAASFGNKTYDTVYALIRGSTDHDGTSISSMYSAVQGKMSKGELDKAIEFLSNEGHIYSTVDEEHFKTTDGD